MTRSHIAPIYKLKENFMFKVNRKSDIKLSKTMLEVITERESVSIPLRIIHYLQFTKRSFGSKDGTDVIRLFNENHVELYAIQFAHVSIAEQTNEALKTIIQNREEKNLL